MAVGTITQLNLNPALGAYNSSEPGFTNWGGLAVGHYTVQPTSGANYTTGGSAVPAAVLGLNKVLGGIATAITQVATVGPGEVAVLPQADGSIKLKCGTAAGAGENAANADLSGTSVDLFVWGY